MDLAILGPLGCGGVDMSAIMGAKICNCAIIIAVDVVESRLRKPLELGATHVINGKDAKDVPAEIKKITGQGC